MESARQSLAALALLDKSAPTPWDAAARAPLKRAVPFGKRHEFLLEPGVRFFILALEALGARTFFSCEGHPDGFYVVFVASYKLAREIHAAGFGTVSIARIARTRWRDGNRLWRLDIRQGLTDRRRRRILRWMSLAWWEALLWPRFKKHKLVKRGAHAEWKRVVEEP